MDEASEGRRTRDQTVTKVDRSEDFWSSTTTFELDDGASDPQSSGGSQNGRPEFINHGFLLWNQIRQQWIGNKRSKSVSEIQEPTISSNATYDNLLGTNKPFPQPIPLREMINFLVDIWEQDGLYD